MMYVPFIALLALIIYLLVRPAAGFAKPATVAALFALAAHPSGISTTLQQVGPSLYGVLIVMTAVHLAASMATGERGGDLIGSILTRALAGPLLTKVPASLLVPMTMLPLAMGLASLIHNIPAVAILTPLAFTLCVRLRVPCVPTLIGLIPASNLGGASAAWGDTPAILQRQVWGFDVATFAANMMPRNLAILGLLMLAVGTWSVWTDERGKSRWLDVFECARLRDQMSVGGLTLRTMTRAQWAGCVGLLGLFLAQLMSPPVALAGSMLIFGGLLVFRPANDVVRSTFVLGYEAVLSIASLFILSASIEQSQLFEHLVQTLVQERSGAIELIAFLVTALISADGAAAMLAANVHAHHDGSLEAAWSLASGICAGSSALLTSASAGPVMIDAARRIGAPITFARYAAFGVPFSVVMLIAYLHMA